MDVEITWDWLLDRVVVPPDRTACWEWQKSVDGRGHPKAGTMRGGRDNGNWFAPHRAVYLSFVGDIPSGHVVHHACENKRCLNPAHLEALNRREHYMERHDAILKAARISAAKRRKHRV